MTNEGSGPTIILVDDHDDSREIVATWLRSEGWLVLDFDRAEPALTAIINGEGALLVTDLTLPGMTGAELATRVRDQLPANHLPMIALTGREDVRFGPGELFDDLIVKPFDPEDLIAAVERHLSAASRVSRTVPRPEPPERRISRTSTS